MLRAYETWVGTASHIDGDFALVIWDARRHEAFCARDRMGTNPSPATEPERRFTSPRNSRRSCSGRQCRRC
ncbi:hypothetical protein [Candidatus Skiveiella danica]|uniref:hypothetical protein n=1 Tax=Candidatus Skiveiella danica TaxID=3386177 RepID=UPI0039B8B6A2